MKPRSSGSGRGKTPVAQNVLVQKLEHLAVPNQVRLAVRSRHQDNHSRIDQSVPQLYEMQYSPRAPRPDQHGLGGAQIEGRQAVRELLIARKRRAFEV